MDTQTNTPRIPLWATLGVAVLATAGCDSSSNNRAPAPVIVELAAAKLLIEHNASDEDTGFQGFADGEPWNELTIANAGGTRLVTVTASGGLFDYGLTELFFETNEPPNDEVSIPDVLSRVPEGHYAHASDQVNNEVGRLVATLTHDIPEGPELLTPEDEAEGVDPAALIVSWEQVDEDLDGDPANIVGYQVIVEEEVDTDGTPSFYEPTFTAFLPADTTSLSIPAAFMQDDACYGWEVLAIEDSGNQTLSSAGFETGDGCAEDPEEDETPRVKVAKLLIEHNATDEDTGFQVFADADPWDELTISGPGAVQIARANTGGGLAGFGLTEFFFETNEPPNDEVSIDDVLSRLPEGSYTFRGVLIDGTVSTLEATFTHDIPQGPVLLTPADEEEDVDPDNTVVSWLPVTMDLDGAPVQILGYQVIVEVDEEPEFDQGFARSWLSVFLPADVTSIRLPSEFMQSDADYEYEVLAIEASGNQTLSSAEFSTE